MNKDFGQEWLKALEERFGEVNEILPVQSEGMPKIYVLYFYDLPEKGSLTAITCGLSNANNPNWKFGRPELIVTLDTSDRSWGLGTGYFASAFFGKKDFSYGDIFKIDDPLSDESEMNAFLVFGPSFLNQDEAKFELSDRTISLTGMYPLYEEEIELYDKIGLEKFWHREGFEIYNPKRKNTT